MNILPELARIRAQYGAVLEAIDLLERVWRTVDDSGAPGAAPPKPASVGAPSGPDIPSQGRRDGQRRRSGAQAKSGARPPSCPAKSAGRRAAPVETAAREAIATCAGPFVVRELAARAKIDGQRMAQVCSRLAAAGELTRIRRGVYERTAAFRPHPERSAHEESYRAFKAASASATTTEASDE